MKGEEGLYDLVWPNLGEVGVEMWALRMLAAFPVMEGEANCSKEAPVKVSQTCLVADLLNLLNFAYLKHQYSLKHLLKVDLYLGVEVVPHSEGHQARIPLTAMVYFRLYGL